MGIFCSVCAVYLCYSERSDCGCKRIDYVGEREEPRSKTKKETKRKPYMRTQNRWILTKFLWRLCKCVNVNQLQMSRKSPIIPYEHNKRTQRRRCTTNFPFHYTLSKKKHHHTNKWKENKRQNKTHWGNETQNDRSYTWHNVQYSNHHLNIIINIIHHHLSSRTPTYEMFSFFFPPPIFLLADPPFQLDGEWQRSEFLLFLLSGWVHVNNTKR